MWPWFMIVAGTLLIIGALVARHRMMRDYRAGLEVGQRAEAGPGRGVEGFDTRADDEPDAGVQDDDREAPPAPAPAVTPTAPPAARTAPAAPTRPAAPPTRVTTTPPLATRTAPTSDPAMPVAPSPTWAPAAPAAPAPVAPVPAFARAADTPTLTTRREVKAARAAGQPIVTGPPPLFADLPVGHRLTTAPTVRVRSQDVPLQDWLRYYAEGSAWSGVVQSISDRVTGDPLLQPYFGSLDRTTLQRHVMSTVMMLTGEGVTVGAVRRLADAHLRHVRSGGQPVTEAVWNRMAATLGNALREHNAPEAAILSLNTTVSPLRSVLVSRDGA
ncbi:hypothetical protein ACOCJ5_07150 [Knoellia sp. CPCC 206450]|uniref:hypothetical protein n=1 Tax=Knoellia tibetensis TaxID=3404798 RepID=UPI003B42A84A